MMLAVIAVSLAVLLLAAILRAAGASLVRTPRADAVRDAAERVKGAAAAARLLEQRETLQPSIAMVHTALLVGVASPLVWAASRTFEGLVLFVVLVGLAVGIVILADFLPRAFGRRRPKVLAYRFSPVLTAAVRLGCPAADLIVEEDDRSDPDDEDDVEEKELISSVLEFGDTVVREVMVPRTDVVWIGNDASTDEALDLFLEHGFSRLPVVSEGPDDVVGVCFAKDLLGLMDRGEQARPVSLLMHPVEFVPETKPIADLLREMQARRAHMAIVVDEFGGTAGIVTIEDLLEELVGEIVDEYDTEAPLVVAQQGSWIIDGRFPVEELSELLGIPLPDEDWDTVGGLVLGLAGRVPAEGETVEHLGVELTTLRVQGRRVASVRARLAAEETA